MSKAKFTEADVKRAVKGVIDGGGKVASVDPTGAYLSQSRRTKTAR
jgi:hypothetical protein